MVPAKTNWHFFNFGFYHFVPYFYHRPYSPACGSKIFLCWILFCCSWSPSALPLVYRVHNLLIIFVIRHFLTSGGYTSWSGGNKITLRYCDVFKCIAWYQICFRCINSNWFRGHEINHWCCNFYCCIAWYQICHQGGNANWSGGDFRSCVICWCIAWYQIFCHLTISSMVCISLVIFIPLLLWLIQEMRPWKFSCFSMFTSIAPLQVFPTAFSRHTQHRFESGLLFSGMSVSSVLSYPPWHIL